MAAPIFSWSAGLNPRRSPLISCLQEYRLGLARSDHRLGIRRAPAFGSQLVTGASQATVAASSTSAMH
jgi:hypothetical protein